MIDYIKIKVPIYSISVHVIVSEEINDGIIFWNKKQKEIKLTQDLECSSYALCYDCNQQIIIFKKDHFTFSTIVHEFLHAIIGIHRRKDMKLVEESEESYTYMLGWLINEFCIRYNKLKGEEFFRKDLIASFYNKD